jgi:hypothetical protein
MDRKPARPPMAERFDGMRIGGLVMLALAAWQLVERFVLSFWLELDTSLARTVGFATFDALLGVAMLQGSDTARKVVLWLTGLATTALAVAIVGLYLGGFGHLWPILASAAASTVGIFTLNFSREPRLKALVVALSLVGAGWIGSVLSSLFLVGTLDLSTLNMIREWSSTERTFEDQDAGLRMKVPTRWVVLKQGNPVVNQDKALVTFANTEVVSFAQIFSEARTYSSADSVEYFLDAIVKTREKENGFQQLERSDATVGAATARRMKTSWRRGASSIHGYFTAWRDGDVFYHLYLLGPGVLAKRLDNELHTLEQSMAFSAPWSSFLREKAGPIRAACPLLSEQATLLVARALSKDAEPELYCREAYRLAFRGQPHLDAASGEHLRTLMTAFFAAIPRGQIDAFGAYVERLRAGQRTSPTEDREMTAVARAAVERLPPASQEALRGYFGMAIEMGRFEAGS